MTRNTWSRWLRHVRSRFPSRGRRGTAHRPSCRPQCEALEDRCVPSYSIVDLGGVAPSAINNAGVLAGSWNTHAAVVCNGFITDLGTLGGPSSQATGINSAGVVVGSAATAGGSSHAFLVSPEDTDGDGRPDSWYRDSDQNGINDLMTDLGTLGGTTSAATAVNDAGQVAGQSSTASSGWTHAFLWTGAGGMQDLGTFGGSYARAAAINNAGQVVGTAFTQMFVPFRGSTLSAVHAFLWDPASGGRLLGQLPGDTASEAFDINDAGQVVGSSGSIATIFTFTHYVARENFLAQGGTLSGLGFSSADASINNNGQIVGANYLSQSGGRADLNDLLDPSQGWTIASAADINDAGQVVGQGTHDGVNPSYFVLSAISASQPSLSVGNVTVTEGDAGSVDAVFTVTLSGSISQVSTIDFTTVDGTATAGTDYVATSGTLTFNPGDTTATIRVPVLGDLSNEYTEAFSVRLSHPTGDFIFSGQTATATILDNDPPPQLSISDVAMKEGKTNTYTSFVFTISLSAPSAKPVSVYCNPADGTATAGGKQADYYSSSFGLTFSPGQTSQTISITVIGDNRREPNETFFINLSNAVNASILDGQGVGTILNDD